MKPKKNIIDRVMLRIKKRKGNVFILKDFKDLIKEYDYDQVLRALRQLIKTGMLIRIGHGIYAKTRMFDNGVILPNATLGILAEEALQKLGVKTDKSTCWYEYNSGASDQMPTGRVIAVDRRVRRKIGYNGFEVFFERMKCKKKR